VSARWIVPPIGEASSVGFAATWIGAEGSGSYPRPLIQVGTNEVRDPSETSVDNTHYYAFWSDRRAHFRGISLFPVTPLTEVVARLRFSHGRWTVQIRDTDSGRESRFTIKQEPRATTSAEWEQEDVERLGTGVRFPYPRLEGTEFRDVAVNGRSPAQDALLSSWMSIGTTLLRPGPLVGGAFAVLHGAVSAEGERYLRLAEKINVHYERIDRESSRWGLATPRHLIDAARRQLLRALTLNISELDREPWPGNVAPLIRALVRATRTARAKLETEPMPGAPGYVRTRRESVSEREAIGRLAVRIRSRLGIPQLAPTHAVASERSGTPGELTQP
jgi:hypothetical protein